MRTLPLRLPAIDGESLPGYITRYAQCFATQPGDVICALGLEEVDRYGVWLSPDQLRGVAHATGLDGAAAEGMLLARYRGRAFGHPPGDTPITLTREIAAREVSVWTTRLCPHCLGEDGAWRVGWQLSWSVACTRHRVLLVRRCSRCQAAPRVGSRTAWPRDHAGDLADSARCARRQRGKLCRAPLTTTTVAADPVLVTAQGRIDALLDGTQTSPRLAGQQLDGPVYLRDLRTLAVLLHALAPARDAPTTQAEQACGGSRRTLDDPLSLADVLPQALALADLPDPEALADTVRELADRHYRARKTPLWELIRRAAMSPTLTGALRRGCNQAAYTTPSRRIGLHPRAYRRPTDLDDRLQARHVPQLFWAADYQHKLAGLFDFDDFSARLARRFCSVLLARMLAPLDWPGAVGYLDFPPRFINDGYNTTFAKLRAHDRYDRLAAGVKQIANQHVAAGPIDYKQRRMLLADWSGIDPATWQLLAARTRARSPDTPTRASLWLWCELTSGHEHAAPIAPSNPEINRQTEFERRHIPALRQPLTLLGELLLNTPPDARSTLTNRLAAALHQQGQLPGHSRLDSVDTLIAERILAITSAHTGIDTPSLTTPSSGSRAPAAVTHARLLAGALLRYNAHASWTAVAAILGGSPNRLANSHRAYSATIARDTTLAAELEQLTRDLTDWNSPLPVTPRRPHNERMPEIAAAIRAHATTLLPTHLAPRASMLACRSHTDLTWPQIAALHDLPAAQPALTRATVARHHCDTDFAERYHQLLDRAQRVRDAAGYSTAQLARGLTTRPRQENPMTAQQETSCQTRNYD